MDALDRLMLLKNIAQQCIKYKKLFRQSIYRKEMYTVMR